jgi:hypothetical protein
MAHPAKDSSSPWWYGMLLQEGKSGWFPNNYVEEIKREYRCHVERISLRILPAHDPDYRHLISPPSQGVIPLHWKLG